MTIKKIQNHLKQNGIYTFKMIYNKNNYEITIVMFTKNKEIILFEAIESIRIINNGIYESVQVNEKIITHKFLKEITKITGCFETKKQHRPPRRFIKKWMITENAVSDKNNDIITYQNGKLEIKNRNRENLFVSKNRFNLFFNNSYFYFENGFFKIIEDYLDIIENQSKLRHIEIDKMNLFIVYCLSDDCIIKYLEMLLDKTYKWLENNNLKLIDIYRLDYIEYEKNLTLMAKNFLYHIMKIDIEKIKPRPVSFTENIMPLTKNFSFVIDLNNEKFLFVPFNPKDGILIAFKDNTILENDFEFSFPIESEQEILNQIIFGKNFLRDKIIVIPSDEKYLSFAKKYCENSFFDLEFDLELFVMNEFGDKPVKMDSYNFKVNEDSNLIELTHKKNGFSIVLNKDILIKFKVNNIHDLNSEFAFVNYLDSFNIKNFYFFVRFKSETYLCHLKSN